MFLAGGVIGTSAKDARRSSRICHKDQPNVGGEEELAAGNSLIARISASVSRQKLIGPSQSVPGEF